MIVVRTKKKTAMDYEMSSKVREEEEVESERERERTCRIPALLQGISLSLSFSLFDARKAGIEHKGGHFYGRQLCLARSKRERGIRRKVRTLQERS